MKRITSTLLIIGASAITVFMSSCGSTGPGSFAKAKYYHFGHNDPVVVFNKTNHATENKASVVATSQPEVAPVESDQLHATAPVVTTQAKVEKKAANKTKDAVAVSEKVSENNSGNSGESIISASPENNQADKATQEGGSGVDPVVLIILAILLSPLAVYLYDNAATTRFVIDLVCWILGVGFGFGVFLFAGLLWLFAVIYAIIIVTGTK